MDDLRLLKMSLSRINLRLDKIVAAEAAKKKSIGFLKYQKLYYIGNRKSSEAERLEKRLSILEKRFKELTAEAVGFQEKIELLEKERLNWTVCPECDCTDANRELICPNCGSNMKPYYET